MKGCTLVLFLLAAGMVGCKKNAQKTEGQNLPQKSTKTARLADCPSGYNTVLTYEIDQFSFHRPKFGCQRGFFICVDGHWTTSCVPQFGFIRASIADGKAQVWAEIQRSRVVLHFPAGLKTLPGYTREDLAIFSVDEQYELAEGITLKPGSYPVREENSELLVTVDLL